MSTELLAALVASWSAIFLAILTYWLTKKRERESELRREKLEHYKELAACMSGILRGESTPESHRAYSLIRNRLNLVAPYAVLKALREYGGVTSRCNPAPATQEEHDKLLSKLFFEIRKDLGMNPKDEQENFRVGLWASSPSGQRDGLNSQAE